ncbi:S8 family serine peptidase [Streptomyces sp. YIM B13508]|uniref:S8 family serine peptidase n=1 Tax=Streptomyces sp. YIM B13508 TaxID=3366315 RepID=UPI00368C871A
MVVFDPNSQESGLNSLLSSAGIAPVQRVRGADIASVVQLTEGPDVSLFYEDLAFAVVEVRPEQRYILVTTAEEEGSILAAEPERKVYASPVIASQEAPTEFFPAYRSDDAVVALQSRVETASSLGPAWDEANVTWGIQAIRAHLSGVTGAEVKIAVLDTGVDTDHPDLIGCIEETASFVLGESAEDVHGHGTHCIGTAAGPAHPQHGPRYGVATEARVLAGKVLNTVGEGADGQILAGIAWAIDRGARVISLSLGAPVRPGTPFPQTYELVAQRALEHGTVIVAAAGNSSQRPGVVSPVERPANCPSILAVASVDRALEIASSSCGGINGQGGEVNVAAPGKVVHSAAVGGGYVSMSGTSMATPHVAGVLALYAQDNTDSSATELTASLLSGAFPLEQPARDVGAGLVQAP